MHIKWVHRKFTFMLIPGANRSVMRAHIPRSLLWIVPLIIISLAVIGLFWLYGMQHGYLRTISNLHSKMFTDRRHSQLLVAEKDQTIDSLQSEVAKMSQYANEVKKNLEGLKELEKQLHPDASGNSSSLSSSGSDSSASSVHDSGQQHGPYAGTNRPQMNSDADSLQVPGEGGEAISPSDKQIAEFVEQTEQSFLKLNEDIAKLNKSLSGVLKQMEERTRILRLTPSIWPTNHRLITSAFGIRQDPITRKLSFHSGLDIDGDEGDPVYAAADGKVTHVGYDGDRGNNVIINHSRGIETIYMHLRSFAVREGDQVSKGEKIGTIGTTGRSTGSHLHYEIHVNGKEVNPLKYLP